MHWAGKAIPAVFVIGVGVGACTSRGDATPVEVTVTRTKYLDRVVEREVEVNLTSIPTDCAKALSLVESVSADATRLVGVGTKTMDILADGHQALTIGDGTGINIQRDKLYKLEVSANGASQDLALIHLPKLDSALSACKATEAYKEKK